MNILRSSNSDPYWNLATEEFLLKNSQEDFVFLYTNRPCVVVGKHQNAQKEINSKFLHENGISVARRLSGGGTVYHDEGNLNFSFIRSVPFGSNISYKAITQTIFGSLKEKFPDLVLSERNDFLINGKKISGSAMHVFKNRILAHGTLLVSCNLAYLSTALKSKYERFEDKSIASRRSEVANLTTFDINLNINKIIENYTEYVEKTDTVQRYTLPESAVETIRQIVASRYADNNWIFGYSPKYCYNSSFLFENHQFKYSLQIEKGIIESVYLEDGNDLANSIILLFNNLKGMKHNIWDFMKDFNPTHWSEIDTVIVDSLF